MELDIIKHTAQFVAKNGKKFLVSLTEREIANPQFDFLKPTNLLFNFFISLVNAYQKIIQIEESYYAVKNKANILQNSCRIFENLRQKRQQEKKQSELDKEERLLKESIDQQEFYVAETIDFNDNLAYNPVSAVPNNALPVIPQEIPPQEIIPLVHPSRDREEDQTVSKKEPSTVEVHNLLPTVIEENIKIRMDYQRQKYNGKNEMTKCEICGQLIPVDEFNEHLKIEQHDPKNQQMKKDLMQKGKTLSTINDSQIIPILQEMKGPRPDIFGLSAEQFQRQERNDANSYKQVWDRQSSTMTRTSATGAMLAYQNRKTYEELQKMKGVISNSNSDSLDQNSQDNFILTNNELSKLEEGVHLEPEHQWLVKFPGQVTLNIRIPENIERNAKLTGQLIKLYFQPHTTIGVVKAAISEKIGVELDQQNLKSTLFKSLKNEKSMAFYNLFNGSSLELNLK